MKIPQLARLTTAAATVLSLFVPVAVLADHGASGIVLVDGTDVASDAAGCGNVGNPCNTIQAGVDHAVAGEIVMVAKGVYAELVNIHKRVSLQGAQFDNDATERSVPVSEESVVGTPAGAFQITANRVAINGFTVAGVTSALGAGIHTTVTNSGHRITNNIIRDNVMGLYLNSNSTNTSIVSRNLFKDNNAAGPANGTGIYSDQGLRRATIERNKFTGHQSAAITITTSGAPQSNNRNLEISRNTSVNDANMVNMYNSDRVEISRNTAINTNFGATIHLGGNNNNIEISRNIIRNGAWAGVMVRNLGAGSNNSIAIERNTITGMANHGIWIRDLDAVVKANIGRNMVSGNGTPEGGDGIFIEAGNTGNLIERNIVRNNADNDLEDDNAASGGTAGTGNKYYKNDCQTDDPNGLCP